MKNVEDLHFEQQEAQYGNLTAMLRQMYRHAGGKQHLDPDREKTLANARQRLAQATSSLAQDTEPVDLERLEQGRPLSVGYPSRNEHRETLLPPFDEIAEAPLRGARTNKEMPGRLKRLMNTLAAAISITLIALLFGGTVLFLRQAHPQQGHQQTPQTIQQSPPAQLYAVSGTLNAAIISRLDPASGRALWHFAMKPIGQNGRLASGSPGSLQVVKGILYFEGTDADGVTIYALNAATGTLVWKAPVGGAGAGLMVANSLVYTAQSSFGNDSLLALNALSGQQVWKQHFPGSAPEVIDNMQVVGATSSVLYAVSYQLAQEQSLLYALDAQTGQVLWQKPVSHPEEITVGKIVGSTLYLAGGVGPGDQGQGTSIYAYNLSTGTQLWSTPIEGSVNTLEVEQHALYAMTFDKNQQGEDLPGSIYALRASDGLLLWQQRSNSVLDTLLVAGGELYVADSDGTGGSATHITIDGQGKYHVFGGSPWHLEALRESDGHLDWQQTLSAEMGRPLLFGSDLYLPDINRMIHVLDPSNGKQIKTIPISGIISSTSGVMLFVA